MKITVEPLVNAALNKVWDAWNSQADIQQWNSPAEDGRTTRSIVDLREGGKFLPRTEAKSNGR